MLIPRTPLKQKIGVFMLPAGYLLHGVKTFLFHFASSWRFQTQHTAGNKQEDILYIPQVDDEDVSDWTLGASLLSLPPYANAPRKNRGDGGV